MLVQRIIATATGLVAAVGVTWAEASSPVSIRMELAGTYSTGVFDEGAAEIPAYAPSFKRLFVVNGAINGIDVLDISDPNDPHPVPGLSPIRLADYGSPNSVAVKNGIVAVAVEAPTVTDPGTVRFYRPDGTFLNAVTVGALPDMLLFSKDGKTVLVANEGEPDGGLDPEGSISIIDLSKGVRRATATTAGFSAFNAMRAELQAKGVRFPDPAATVAQDVEPEYVALSPDGRKAWVTLQENNALAVVDVTAGAVTDIIPLGTKNHSRVGSGLDASDEDGRINIRPWPVRGMYMPDAIVAFEAEGRTWLITANEGDDRGETARVADLPLDPEKFPQASTQQLENNLGRLTVSQVDGDTDGDGDFDKLFAYGARSFSIWSGNGKLVHDSGDLIEKLTARAFPDDFNPDNSENDSFDLRSDNKGPEPEGVAVGAIDGRTYAFVGLERIGGVMSFDVTNPRSPRFVQYVNNRNFAGDPASGTAGDLGPEGLLFIPSWLAPTGVPLLVVANEVSGTTSLYFLRRGAACSPLDPRCG